MRILMLNQQPEIPRLFHSVYSDGPFQQCIQCERDLLSSAAPYLIQKNFVGREAVFEMAICIQCQQRMNQELSAETKAAMERFRVERLGGIADGQQSATPEHAGGSTDFQDEIIVEMDPDVAVQWHSNIDHCLFCDRLRRLSHRHILAGVFFADRMIVQAAGPQGVRMPHMMCEDCTMELDRLVSRQTRDEWNRFVDEHFGGPPEIEADWPSAPAVLV